MGACINSENNPTYDNENESEFLQEENTPKPSKYNNEQLLVYGIGYNHFKELGSKHKTPLRELQILEEINKCKFNGEVSITSGSNYSIYYDSKLKNAYFIGIQNTKIQKMKISNLFMVKIKTICHSWMDHKPFNSSKIFFISNKNQPYFMQMVNNASTDKLQNRSHQIISTSLTKISELENVIDITSTDTLDYALCQYSYNVTCIVDKWSNNKFIPDDIMNLIILYHSTNQIFEYNDNKGKKPKWEKLSDLDNKHITKIVATKNECFFIDASGNIWRGNRKRRRVYIGIKAMDETPKYAQFGKIKVKDIRCGFYHVLFTDFDGTCYGFGRNYDGQCGIGTNEEEINEPQKIEGLNEYNIVKIRCGAYHSYAMTKDERHYMFGDNYYYQCLVFEENQSRVLSPRCVNDEFKKQTKGVTIKDVYLGNGNTIIMT